MITDSDILDWLENCHTLHYTVDAYYAVDGYVVEIKRDDHVVIGSHCESLREAYVALMRYRFDPASGAMIDTENLNDHPH